jgi:hypothetical protein
VDLPPDFRELLAEFARSGVEAVLVGGYAVAFHGRPRATKDIGLVLEGSLADVVYLGQPPLRVDLLRTIDGVDPAGLAARAIAAEIDGVPLRASAGPHRRRVPGTGPLVSSQVHVEGLRFYKSTRARSPRAGKRHRPHRAA